MKTSLFVLSAEVPSIHEKKEAHYGVVALQTKCNVNCLVSELRGITQPFCMPSIKYAELTTQCETPLVKPTL